ncbi:MAG: multicopper oxidase family protein [Alphaproteobacteria bacterium]
MTTLTRRDFLATAAAAALAPAAMSSPAGADEAPIVLRAETRTIEVNGKAATMLQISRPDGVWGVYTEAGRRYRVSLENHLGEPTLVHWHGLMPPYQQDGVPDVSQPALEPGGVYAYDFPLAAPGTFWMHSHFGLQEQRLMAAPLIIRDPAEAGLDEQEVVVMLHDFTFRDPDEVFAELRAGEGHGGMYMGESEAEAHGELNGDMDMDSEAAADGHGEAGDMAGMEMASGGAGDMTTGGMTMDLNDIEFDAYLANDRTLADPEVVRVEPGGRVRLRIINAAASTNFFLGLGGLEGDLVAVDGLPVEPVPGRRFPLAIAQRLDIRLALPAGQGAYPVFAHREGGTARTGIVLATSGARIERLADHAEHMAPAVGLDLERRLAAARPLDPRPAERTHVIELTGSMKGYSWGLNGVAYGNHTPLELRAGERVELAFRNRTMMAHPIHMHGLPFQVVEIDGERFQGAMRDTVLVPANDGRVTVAFDAVNPGIWVMHCHNLYHMAAGMMTTLTYLG